MSNLTTDISRTNSIEIATTLLTALSFWEKSHLFPIFDALRFIDLQVKGIILEYLPEIYSTLLRLDHLSSAAILTSSRLLFNLFSGEDVKSIKDTFNFDATKKLVQLIYESGNFKDMLLPLRIISM